MPTCVINFMAGLKSNEDENLIWIECLKLSDHRQGKRNEKLTDTVVKCIIHWTHTDQGIGKSETIHVLLMVMGFGTRVNGHTCCCKLLFGIQQLPYLGLVKLFTWRPDDEEQGVDAFNRAVVWPLVMCIRLIQIYVWSFVSRILIRHWWTHSNRN